MLHQGPAASAELAMLLRDAAEALRLLLTPGAAAALTELEIATRCAVMQALPAEAGCGIAYKLLFKRFGSLSMMDDVLASRHGKLKHLACLELG